MPRMRVLNNVERDTFETPPIFNSVERKRCFDFPIALQDIADGLRSSTNQLGFMLTCGYFRATRRFYPPRSFHSRDLAYLAERAGLEANKATLASYPKQTLARHQSLLLEFYGFRPFKEAGRSALGADIARLVKAQIKPKVIFSRALDLLVREKIEVPSYFPLASLILRAINQHNRALVATVRHLLTAETQALLDSMMQQQAIAGGDAPGKTSAYRLTALKKLSQSTQPEMVKARVADLAQVENNFRSLQPLLQGLALGPEALQYYAQSVLRAEIFQLSRRDEKNRYLHLAAFVAHQYYRLQDNLVAVLVVTMQRLQNRARRQHQEHCYTEREQHHASLKTLLGYFDPGVLETLFMIRALTENTALADSEKVARIRVVLAANETATALDEGKLSELKASVLKDMDDEDYYEFLSAQSLRAQNRVGPILKALNFISEPNAADLKAALDHFKAQDGIIDKRAPVGFLTPKELAAVTGDGTFRVSLYKVLLFVHLQLGIKSGTVNLEHSYKYRPLDAYLIDRDRWQRDKALLIERAGLQAFLDPNRVLEKLDAALYAQYELTNAHIRDGHNKYIKFKKDRFSISTPKQEERDAGPLQEYFPARDVVPLLEILATVNRHTGWMGEFQHWQQRYHREARPDRAIYAGVIALGCTIGLPKMARISHPISETELENTVNWYFSLDNVIAANDRVLKLMDRLELPKLRRRTPGSSHTSSDGQKFEVAVDSLNANYSFKYFGHDQGVSVYTFRDERDLLWHSLVFSSADRESAYVLDGLLKNDVIKSDIHSTDAFGYSEAIFAGSFLVDVAYAPRFKTPYRQRRYIFRSRKDVDQADWTIKPHGYANTDSIIDSWDDILRFIATIKLKETTASDIFRRLNSYSKQHSLYQALKAFGQIPKTLFILRYIDEPPLRMAIERVLNGIEHVHRFTRAVSVGSPQEFLQAEKEGQEMAEACKRLIKNSIICWNYLYLTQKLAEIKDPAKREAFMQAVAQGSAASWGHVNLLGEYDLSEERQRDSVGIQLPKFTD
jgi:TnpA family transposase